MPILKIEKLTKKYGKTYALNGLDMEVKKGDIYGFVGPNGAGKTTTLRIISGLLKSDGGDPSSCLRYTFAYENPKAGEGRFIHTYMHDGNPLPSFSGEPKKVAISGDIDSFTQLVWESLNEENKVSLFVRYIDIETGKYETRIVNKNH